MRAALVACFALAASALSPSGGGVNLEGGLFDEEGELREAGGGLIEGEGLIESQDARRETGGDLIEADYTASSFDRFVDENYGDGGELADGVNLGDLLEEVEQYKPKRRKNGTRVRQPWETDNRTAALDVIIPLLQEDFKRKTNELKGVLRNFKAHQKELDFAKQEATLAMKDLRKEAERRRQAILEKKKLKQKAIEERANARRLTKEAMIKKAQTLVSAHGQSGEFAQLMGDFTLGLMMDVLMALPQAVQNPLFSKRVSKAKIDIATTVQDFLNIPRRKTAKFALASGRASDVELSFLMTRYFHEASFRVKSMHADAQKLARDLNVVMPRELRQAFMPIIKQLREQAVPLRVNASALAAASQADACNEISGLMSNITDYNTKLATMHTSLHNIWQMSELMLPHMSKIYPMTPETIDLVKDFMSLATTQCAGLQESADEIVTQVGPVISERMQCTWSAAKPRFGLGLAFVLAALVAHFFA
mmetsp:Transcript_20797/g.55750  ORF Transcript_20797/g.55750 Transcript_20797/m.55750 type:complete len:480 (-) Transcript_20797:92-1531(-)